MSEKDIKDENSANSNPLSEEKSENLEEVKVNNMLKDRLRKYIKKLDGKTFNIPYRQLGHELKRALGMIFIQISGNLEKNSCYWNILKFLNVTL